MNSEFFFSKKYIEKKAETIDVEVIVDLKNFVKFCSECKDLIEPSQQLSKTLNNPLLKSKVIEQLNEFIIENLHVIVQRILDEVVNSENDKSLFDTFLRLLKFSEIRINVKNNYIPKLLLKLYRHEEFYHLADIFSDELIDCEVMDFQLFSILYRNYKTLKVRNRVYMYYYYEKRKDLKVNRKGLFDEMKQVIKILLKNWEFSYYFHKVNQYYSSNQQRRNRHFSRVFELLIFAGVQNDPFQFKYILQKIFHSGIFWFLSQKYTQIKKPTSAAEIENQLKNARIIKECIEKIISKDEKIVLSFYHWFFFQYSYDDSKEVHEGNPELSSLFTTFLTIEKKKILKYENTLSIGLTKYFFFPYSPEKGKIVKYWMRNICKTSDKKEQFTEYLKTIHLGNWYKNISIIKNLEEESKDIVADGCVDCVTKFLNFTMNRSRYCYWSKLLEYVMDIDFVCRHSGNRKFLTALFLKALHLMENYRSRNIILKFMSSKKIKELVTENKFEVNKFLVQFSRFSIKIERSKYFDSNIRMCFETHFLEYLQIKKIVLTLDEDQFYELIDNIIICFFNHYVGKLLHFRISKKSRGIIKISQKVVALWMKIINIITRSRNVDVLPFVKSVCKQVTKQLEIKWTFVEEKRLAKIGIFFNLLWDSKTLRERMDITCYKEIVECVFENNFSDSKMFIDFIKLEDVEWASSSTKLHISGNDHLKLIEFLISMYFRSKSVNCLMKYDLLKFVEFFKYKLTPNEITNIYYHGDLQLLKEVQGDSYTTFNEFYCRYFINFMYCIFEFLPLRDIIKFRFTSKRSFEESLKYFHKRITRTYEKMNQPNYFYLLTDYRTHFKIKPSTSMKHNVYIYSFCSYILNEEKKVDVLIKNRKKNIVFELKVLVVNLRTRCEILREKILLALMRIPNEIIFMSQCKYCIAHNLAVMHCENPKSFYLIEKVYYKIAGKEISSLKMEGKEKDIIHCCKKYDSFHDMFTRLEKAKQTIENHSRNLFCKPHIDCNRIEEYFEKEMKIERNPDQCMDCILKTTYNLRFNRLVHDW